MDHFPLMTAAVSTGTVALAEIGDKTQLLALLLAARFRKPLPIIAGILVATLLNHALAGWFGTLVAQWLTPEVLRWVVAISSRAVERPICAPKVSQAPKDRAESCRPDEPRRRYCMGALLEAEKRRSGSV